MKINEKYITPDLNIIKEFLENSNIQTLQVSSPMGSGKTNIVRSILEKRNLRVMFITNRVSLGLEFKERFKDYNIKFYQDNDYKINDSIITQYDSLYRFDLEHFDLIILDEFVSILLHSLSFLGDKGHLNLLKLNVILKNKKIIVMDAFFTNDLIFNNAIKIINTYREQTPVIIYKHKNTFLYSLLKEVKNKKISISCSSLLVAKSLYQEIKKINPKVFLLSSETKNNIREKVLKELKNNNSIFDIFIFTPTITTGIDILGDFETHWHYDEGKTCDVISSLQMLKRSRTSNNINIYINGNRRFEITDPEELNKRINEDIKQNKIKNPYLVEMDYNTGNYSLSKLGMFYNYIKAYYNSLENNHKKTFLELLEYQFMDIKTIDVAIDDSGIDMKRIKEEIKEENKLKIKNTLLLDVNNEYKKKAEKIKTELKEIFNLSLDDEIIERFVNNKNEYFFFKNNEFFKRDISFLMQIRNDYISRFNFDTKIIDEIIHFKGENFKLKEIYYKKDLDKRTLNFLKILGYRILNNKILKN